MSLIGIYEKALPKNITWKERLNLAKELEFDFIEISIDETDDRINRLEWTIEQKRELIDAIFETGIKIHSMCLSCHRRYPMGSSDASKRKKSLELMSKAINLASDLGIRVIQLAGYDVYYEDKSLLTREYYIETLKKSVALASEKGVVLSIEIMDDPFINSITKYLEIKRQINSPYLQVYPDLGNLSAWQENNPGYELEIGIKEISQVHLKDTKPVTTGFPGKFKGVPFGEGCVDFLGLLKTLKRLDYNAPFVIEMWSETSSNPREEINKAKQFLNPFFREVGYID